MNLNWELLIDAVMSEDDWQFSAPTDASLLRIEQTNAPTLGRFALGQASVTQLEFFDIKAYPARTESTRITLDEVGEEIRRIAIRYRYGQFPEGTPNTWRVKVYGAKLDLQPAINPSAIVLTFDPRVVGAIPLEEKGIPLGVATLDEDGLVSDDQLPTTGLAELVAANMEALDNLADQLEAITIPPAPTLESLGAEPIGAELRAKAYADEQTSVPTSVSLVPDNSLSPIALAEILIGTLWTTNSNFIASALAVYISQQGTDKLKLALYEKTNNNLLTRIGLSVERSNVPVGTQVFDLINAVAVEPGKVYYICFYAPHGNNYKFAVESAIANGQLLDGNSFNYADGFPVTISGLYFQTNNKIAATAIGNEALKSAFLNLRANLSKPSIEPFVLRMKCGFTTFSYGNDWRGEVEDWVSGGTGYDILQQFPETPSPTNTIDPYIYRHERSGSDVIAYNIPVRRGVYTVRLHFCENYESNVGARVAATIKINDVVRLTNFDILTQAAKYQALIKEFTNIDCTETAICKIVLSNGLINGIEIIQSN